MSYLIYIFISKFIYIPKYYTYTHCTHTVLAVRLFNTHSLSSNLINSSPCRQHHSVSNLLLVFIQLISRCWAFLSNIHQQPLARSAGPDSAIKYVWMLIWVQTMACYMLFGKIPIHSLSSLKFMMATQRCASASMIPFSSGGLLS